MSIPIWPANIQGLTWTVLKTSEGKTSVQASPAQNEVRLILTYNPIWTWTLMYEWIFGNFLGAGNVKAYAPYTDIDTFMGFILACQGQGNDILFDDPSDDTVGPALVGSPPAPNTLAELQLVNDGGSPPVYYSPVQRNKGGLFWEDITDLNGSIEVYADGVLKSEGTDYTILGPGFAIPGYSWMGLVIQWASQPATPVTAQFNFYFRVRLKSDTTDFEQWAQELWTIGGENARNGNGTLKLVSSRPVAA